MSHSCKHLWLIESMSHSCMHLWLIDSMSHSYMSHSCRSPRDSVFVRVRDRVCVTRFVWMCMCEGQRKQKIEYDIWKADIINVGRNKNYYCTATHTQPLYISSGV
eukprot:sb/3477968/